MTKKRKPKLTPAECRYFDEVHQDILRWGRHPSTMDQAFCDTHDGNLYEWEVRPLIRKKLLTKIPMEPCDVVEGCLLGCKWSVFLTPYAIRTLWPGFEDGRYSRPTKRHPSQIGAADGER